MSEPDKFAQNWALPTIAYCSVIALEIGIKICLSFFR